MNIFGIIYLVGFVVSIIILRFIYLYDKSKLTVTTPITGREEMPLDILITPLIWPLTVIFYILVWITRTIFRLLDKLLIKLINKFK